MVFTAVNSIYEASVTLPYLSTSILGTRIFVPLLALVAVVCSGPYVPAVTPDLVKCKVPVVVIAVFVSLSVLSSADANPEPGVTEVTVVCQVASPRKNFPCAPAGGCGAYPAVPAADAVAAANGIHVFVLGGTTQEPSSRRYLVVVFPLALAGTKPAALPAYEE